MSRTTTSAARPSRAKHTFQLDRRPVVWWWPFGLKRTNRKRDKIRLTRFGKKLIRAVDYPYLRIEKPLRGRKITLSYPNDLYWGANGEEIERAISRAHYTSG